MASSPHRNMLYTLLLALSCTHAFVISSPNDWGVPARLRRQQHQNQHPQPFGVRGGASHSGKHRKQSLNVLKVPPSLGISMDGDQEDSNEVNGRSTLTAQDLLSKTPNGGGLNGVSKVITQKVQAAAEYVAETKLPTDVGHFQLRAYRVPGAPLGQEPCVIYARDKPPMGKDGAPAEHVAVRIHDQCLTSEVFRSQR